VFTKLKGKITAADIQGYAQRLKEDLEFVPALSEIVDLGRGRAANDTG